jgi:hypothetical protein
MEASTKMLKPEIINTHAESVLDLLIAQCADLEALLVLARRETQAAEALDFEEVLRIVEDRATLGERLEVYHRQAAEMRRRLGEYDPVLRSEAARRAATLATAILAEDARTKPLMLASRDEAAREYQRLGQSQRCVNAYLREGSHATMAWDQRI